MVLVSRSAAAAPSLAPIHIIGGQGDFGGLYCSGKRSSSSKKPISLSSCMKLLPHLECYMPLKEDLFKFCSETETMIEYAV